MIGPNVYDMQHTFTLRRRVVLTAAFGASLALIVGSPFSPFLYFQF